MKADTKRCYIHIALVLTVYLIQLQASAPRILFDPAGYYGHALILVRDGIGKAVSQTYPMFEPAYGFFLYFISRLVPQSMWLKTVSVIQLGFLLASALMMARLARMTIKTKNWDIAIFYCIALSPGLMTSAQTLFCEIFSMICFVLAVYFVVLIYQNQVKRISYVLGIMSALLTGLLILTKAAFWYVAIATAVTMAVHYLVIKKQVKPLVYIALYLAISLSLPYAWSKRNEAVYGVRAISTRSALVLASRFMRSYDHYTFRDWAIGTITAMSERGARAIFKKVNIDYYTWRRENTVGTDYLIKLAKIHHVPFDKHNLNQLALIPTFDRLAFKQVLRDILSSGPSQIIKFVLFGWFAFVNLLYFETINYDTITIYQNWLENLYDFIPLRIFVRIVLSSFYWIGICLMIFKTTKQFKTFNDTTKQILFVSFTPLFWFFAVYTLSQANMRYTYTVAPFYIYLALIGWSMTIYSKSKNAQG